MSLPSLAPIPGLLQPLASRAEQSWRAAVAGLEGGYGLDDWSPERWSAFSRVSAASDFFIEQSLRDPLMLLELARSGELDRTFAPGELCGQIAAAAQAATSDDELGRADQHAADTGAIASDRGGAELDHHHDHQHGQAEQDGDERRKGTTRGHGSVPKPSSPVTRAAKSVSPARLMPSS